MIKFAKTVDKFIYTKLHQTYNRLVIFSLVPRKRRKVKELGREGVFSFNTDEDIWDFRSLINTKIEHRTIDELKKIESFLRKELEYVPGASHSTNYPPMQRPPNVVHFTGRHNELEHLLAALQPGRVISLCGPGGIGKTALVSEVVRRLTLDSTPPAQFPDGIIYHSFYNEPQTDIALQSIVRAYNEESKPTPKTAASRVLSNRKTLLILDGTEVADNLNAVLDVRGHQCGILITSRNKKDALDNRLDIPPLGPDDSVNLLRCWSKNHSIDLETANQICELTGQLPLAVRLVGRYLNETGETAKTYLNWLINTPLDALDQGMRRQESVPVLLKRSLTQVSPIARKVLGTIGVLALAPFKKKVLSAALGSKKSRNILTRSLGELVTYGLLTRQDDCWEVSHALVHTYVKEELHPDVDVSKRILEFYLNLILQCKLAQKGYASIDHEHQHMMKLLTSYRNEKKWKEALKFSAAIEDYVDVQGFLAERLMVNQIALESAKNLGDQTSVGIWLGDLGLAYRDLGQTDLALECFEKALIINERMGSQFAQANNLGNIGIVYRDAGELVIAFKYFKRSIYLHRKLQSQESRSGEANQLNNIGSIFREAEKYETAINYYKRSLAIHKSMGNNQAVADLIGNLGSVYTLLGQIENAIKYHQQSLDIDRQISYPLGIAIDLSLLGYDYFALEDYEKAMEYFEEGLALARRIGHKHNEASNLAGLGHTFFALGEIDRAIDCIEQAGEIYSGINSHEADECREMLDRLYRLRGDGGVG